MNTITEDFKAAIAAEEKKEQPVQDYVINPEFQGLLDTQTDVSYDELKKLIQKDGVQVPIMVWKENNTILDGHNRHKIAGELGIPLPAQYMSFPDVAAAKEWIIRNQLGRRNLTPARFEYYIGVLYNTTKQERAEADANREGPKTEAEGRTATKIATQFGVGEKTVRRYGEQAKGVELLAKVKGKLAKDKQLSSKPEYTTKEVTAIAKAPNVAVAKRAIAKIDTAKAAVKVKQQEVKQEQAKVEAKAVFYNIALVEPDFEAANWMLTSEVKPTLDKDAIVYMIVPDEHLVSGIKLLDKWGLTYQGSLVFFQSKDAYDSTYTKVIHTMVLIGDKGHLTGPEAGKEATSCVTYSGEVVTSLAKVIGNMHPANLKRVDMRKGNVTLNGWSKPV